MATQFIIELTVEQEKALAITGDNFEGRLRGWVTKELQGTVDFAVKKLIMNSNKTLAEVESILK